MITPLPTPAPSRQNPSTFSSDMDAFLGALPDFVTETNALAVDVSDKQTTASTAASTATTKASEALASANASAASAVTSGNYAAEAASLTESYQGSLASDPALDKNNNPLTAGDWYINSVSNNIRIYTGSIWTNGLSAIAGVSSVNTLMGDVTLKTIDGQAVTGTGNITNHLFNFSQGIN